MSIVIIWKDTGTAIYQVPKYVAVLNKALSFVVGVCRIGVRQQRFFLSSGQDKTCRNEW